MRPTICLTLLLLASSTARAEDASERNWRSPDTPAAKMSRAAGNQLGILEYCQAQHLASSAAVRAERAAIDDAPTPSLSAVHAEELGKKGTLASPDGDQITLAQMAIQHATTVPAMCKDLADSALAFEAFLQQHPPLQ
jgi:hypothetical protein